MSGHTIAWKIDGTCSGIEATVTCNEPPDAACRTYCRKFCEGDGYSTLNLSIPGVCPVCGEPLETGADCNLITWIENSDGWMWHYDGPSVSLHDGPIEFVWSGDDWSWNYASRSPESGHCRHCHDLCQGLPFLGEAIHTGASREASWKEGHCPACAVADLIDEDHHKMANSYEGMSVASSHTYDRAAKIARGEI